MIVDLHHHGSVEGKFAAAKVTEVLNLWKELHVSVSKFAKNLEKVRSMLIWPYNFILNVETEDGPD